MSRMNWKIATHSEVKDFLASARKFAAANESPAVRMFVFQLCKGVEVFMKKEARRAETQEDSTRL